MWDGNIVYHGVSKNRTKLRFLCILTAHVPRNSYTDDRDHAMEEGLVFEVLGSLFSGLELL